MVFHLFAYCLSNACAENTKRYPNTLCVWITYSFRFTDFLSYVFIDPRNSRRNFCSGSEIRKYSSLRVHHPLGRFSLSLSRSLTVELRASAPVTLAHSLAPVDMSVTVNKQFFFVRLLCVSVCARVCMYEYVDMYAFACQIKSTYYKLRPKIRWGIQSITYWKNVGM